MAYFCEQSGVRIAAPGVCKAVDPEHGQELEDAPPPEQGAGALDLDAAKREIEQLAAAERAKHAGEIETIRAERERTERSMVEAQQGHEAELGAALGAHAAATERLQGEIERLKGDLAAANELLGGAPANK